MDGLQDFIGFAQEDFHQFGIEVGVDSGEAVGAPVVSSGFVIQATSVSSGETFGVAVVEIGTRNFFFGATQVETIKVGDLTVTAGYYGPALVW